ncbi:MAG TPA: TylF/MycF/NovP-related O-methyltransferase [Azospirillaceae bacterium]|nr:TylF/MycF/NovP-related O-methyltransferase [Azospirillaceae bacterium]
MLVRRIRSFVGRNLVRAGLLTPRSPGPVVLPDIPDMGTAPRKGRVVRDGYARGWGIQHGGLEKTVRGDPDYRAAVLAAGPHSLLDDTKLMNLYLLIRFYLPRLERGDIVEFGSYRGGSAMFMAMLCKRYLPGVRVWGLDTFEGMPATDHDLDAHRRGSLAETSLERVQAAAAGLGLDNLTFVKGLFEDTAEGVLEKAGRVALAHIDCDIAGAVAYSWDTVKPRMVPGGYVIFDDATDSSCIGATEVVEDLVIRRDGLCSEQVWPHFVFRWPPVGPA